MQRTLVAATCGSLLALTACGGPRTTTEHQLIQWAQALNAHLATDSEGGYSYPRQLSEVDPMLRVGLSFDDAWGNALHYRRVNDGKYDLASPGPDGEIGTEDDVVLSNAALYKPEKVYAERPARASGRSATTAEALATARPSAVRRPRWRVPAGAHHTAAA